MSYTAIARATVPVPFSADHFGVEVLKVASCFSTLMSYRTKDPFIRPLLRYDEWNYTSYMNDRLIACPKVTSAMPFQSALLSLENQSSFLFPLYGLVYMHHRLQMVRTTMLKLTFVRNIF